MRPRGEARVNLGAAAAELGRRGATFRDLAHLGRVDFEVARETLRAMARAGEIEVIGRQQVPGVCRPLNRYAVPLPATECMVPPQAALADVLRSWADSR